MSGTSSRDSKRRKKTFPKEGEKKLKDTIQKLRARNRYLEKKIKWYERNLVDVAVELQPGEMYETSVGTAKVKDRSDEKKEDFRKRFLADFRESLKKRQDDKD